MTDLGVAFRRRIEATGNSHGHKVARAIAGVGVVAVATFGAVHYGHEALSLWSGNYELETLPGYMTPHFEASVHHQERDDALKAGAGVAIDGLATVLYVRRQRRSTLQRSGQENNQVEQSA